MTRMLLAPPRARAGSRSLASSPWTARWTRPRTLSRWTARSGARRRRGWRRRRTRATRRGFLRVRVRRRRFPVERFRKTSFGTAPRTRLTTEKRKTTTRRPISPAISRETETSESSNSRRDSEIRRWRRHPTTRVRTRRKINSRRRRRPRRHTSMSIRRRPRTRRVRSGARRSLRRTSSRCARRRLWTPRAGIKKSPRTVCGERSRRWRRRSEPRLFSRREGRETS
mmetsp:Transcript_13021/g.54688  ORF Transcript_13021/g.54688 Transcript_13021/m.54688 type:complete len:226 (-) Transcript_13021:1473-2150(-)